MARDDGYTTVRYACINTPDVQTNTDGHTVGKYAFGNPAGARWGAAYRPKKCEKCGGTVVGGVGVKRLRCLIGLERRAQGLDAPVE